MTVRVFSLFLRVNALKVNKNYCCKAHLFNCDGQSCTLGLLCFHTLRCFHTISLRLCLVNFWTCCYFNSLNSPLPFSPDAMIDQLEGWNMMQLICLCECTYY